MDVRRLAVQVGLRLLAPLTLGCAARIDPGAPAAHDQALACTSEGARPAALPAVDETSREATLARPRGTWVPTWVPPSSQRAATGPTVVYLNRDGATLTGNYDDAAHGASSVLAGVGKASATIAPFPGSDGEWQQIVACVKDEFARFAVTITDQRPTTPDFYMAMFGSDASALGLPPNVGGVAPLDNYSCQDVPKAVVFIFSGTQGIGGNAQLNCEIAAQEISHAFSLDHELLASDPMTYLPYGGHKTFQDASAQCGESQPRPCVCNRPSQNSVAILGQHLGLAGAAPMGGEQDGGGPMMAPPDMGSGGNGGGGGGGNGSGGNGGSGGGSSSGDDGGAQGGPPNTGGGGAGDGPSVTVNADGSAFDSARTVTLRATVVASGSRHVSSVTLRWSDATGATQMLPMCHGGGASWSVTMMLAAENGARTLSVVATDDAGATTTSAPLELSIDK